jgi:tetratricopeptide (TPR) repeat protein
MRFSVPYNSLGIYYAEKGDWLKAENCYRKALEISPSFPDPYHNLFLLYSDLGDAEKALAYEERYQTLKAAALAAGR